MTEPTSHTLDVPGARLYYEVRGSGPLLFIIGAPMDTTGFVDIARLLADEHTVVTYDPRGISRSTCDDPTAVDTPELRADDVHRLIDAVVDERGGGPVDVFGSSGGAVTGLALVARFPEQVRTLVAHEPPLIELLSGADRERELAIGESILATYRQHGPFAAIAQFMEVNGLEPPPGAPSADAAPPPFMESNLHYFFGRQMSGTTHYLPDVEALCDVSSRIVIGVGSTAPGMVTVRTSTALASRLGASVVEFPGDHGGFMTDPEPFARLLSAVLAEAPVSH